MFDPPHIAHLVVAGEARWQLGLDEVLLVVCARPPHRDDPWLPAEARMRLVEAAVAGDPGLVASRLELDRPALSYTVDTLEEVAGAEAGARLFLVIGADQLRHLASWHRPERIVELATLAVVGRDGGERSGLEPIAASLGAGPVEWIDMPRIDVSSTMVRERLRAGRPVRHLVPDGVADLLGAGGFLARGSAIP